MRVLQPLLVAWMSFLLAGAAAYAFVLTAAPAPSEAADPSTPPSPTCPRARGLEAELRDAEARLQQLEQRVMAARHNAAPTEGTPLAWPQPPDPRVQPSVVRRAMAEALARSGGRVWGVDCTEYPCMAVVRFRPEPSGPYAQRDAFQRALQAAGHTPRGEGRAHTDAQGRVTRIHQVYAFLSATATPEPHTEQRLQARYQELEAALEATQGAP